MEIDRELTSLLLVARPIEGTANKKVRWALEGGLGIMMDSWFIPLATAEPNLLMEFERD